MWSLVPIGGRPLRGRGEEELAKFARREYGSSEIGWLLAEYRRRQAGGFWARVRSSIVRRLTGRTRRSRELRERGVLSATEFLAVEDEPDAGPCPHPALEYLGSGGGAAYRRCMTCESILITQRGREVIIPRSERRASAIAKID